MFPPFLTFLTTVILPQLEKKRAYSHAVKFSPPGWRALRGMSDNVRRVCEVWKAHGSQQKGSAFRQGPLSKTGTGLPPGYKECANS